jgi:hypothetical protein
MTDNEAKQAKIAAVHSFLIACENWRDNSELIQKRMDQLFDQLSDIEREWMKL